MPALCVIQGDGIGREVIPAATTVLRHVMPDLTLVEARAGWETFLECGEAAPAETLAAVRLCGAALFGAVSSPSYKVDGYRSAILTIRQELDLYANIRPVRSLPNVGLHHNVNLVIVRENTEGLYSGRESGDSSRATAERVITRFASFRIGRKAIEILQAGHYRKLTIVHKANILPISDGLFRNCVREAIEGSMDHLGGFEVEDMLVDTAAYRLASTPWHFDVIVTTNLFGDILSDVAACWGGGLGMVPSINLGDALALAEPVHGSAPDIAGQGVANPVAAILSGALIARYYWKQEQVAQRIERAVDYVMRNHLPFSERGVTPLVSTQKILDLILQAIDALEFVDSDRS